MYNVALVGDAGVGKTSLICSLIHNLKAKDAEEYLMYTETGITVSYNNMDYPVSFWEVNTNDDFKSIRTLLYPQADLFLLCYAIDDIKSYHNLFTKWIPEIRQHRQDAALLFVCTKTDIRGVINKIPRALLLHKDASWVMAAEWKHTYQRMRLQHRLYRVTHKPLSLFRTRPKRSVPPADGSCPFDWLPDELVIKIFSYLFTPDLGAMAQTCSRMWNLANDAHIWQLRGRGGKLNLTSDALRAITSDEHEVVQHTCAVSCETLNGIPDLRLACVAAIDLFHATSSINAKALRSTPKRKKRQGILRLANMAWH